VRVIDAEVLGRLAGQPAPVFTDLPVDNSRGVVIAEKRYAIYTSSVGWDINPRLSGVSGARSVFFAVEIYGRTLEQAKWVGESIRDRLTGWRPVIPGHRCSLVNLEQSQRIRRDDEIVATDTHAVYVGLDEYAVVITVNHGS